MSNVQSTSQVEIIEALSLVVPKRKSGSVLMLQAYVRVKMLIGIRRGDMLRLRMSDITDVGITVRPHKTANSTGLARTFEWTPALRAAVDMALVARPIDIAPWLFCTKHGEGYSTRRRVKQPGGTRCGSGSCPGCSPRRSHSAFH